VTGEPFTPQHAKELIRQILTDGTVSFTKHAREEMAKDNLTTVDCVNVLRGGVVESPELKDGTWRYRVRTARIYVVVAFRSETHLVVITAWRTKP
jgi:hypothetical protein